MASSSALCVRGLARLTSSASSSCVKIGPLAEMELLAGAVEHRHADDVGRQQVAGELHALPGEPEHVRERVRERRLADARHVLDQQVAARQQAGEAQPDLPRLAEDDGLERCERAPQASRHPVLAALRVVHGPAAPRTRSSWLREAADGVLELGARARARRATTAAGALRTKLSLASLRARSSRGPPAPCARSLPRRSASAAASMRPGHGHEERERRPPARWRTAARLAPARARVERLEARQPLEPGAVARDELAIAARRRPAAARGMRRAGLMFISPRIWRTRENHRLDPGDLALGLPRRRDSRRRADRAASMTVAPPRPASGATRCQISSVMNGMKRMQRALQRLEDLRAACARVPRLARPRRHSRLQHRLGELQVPVAEVVPGELVERAWRRSRSGSRASALSTVAEHAAEARADPAVGDRQLHGAPAAASAALADRERHEARGVPQLVAEVAVAGRRAPDRSGSRGSGRRARRR